MNKLKLENAVKNIPAIANKENWTFTLDKEEGSLFYAPKIIPNNSALYQITDEYAIYLDNKNSKPTGVVVEYYQGNFLQHHKIFNKFNTKLFKTKEKERKIVVVDSRSAKNEDIETFRALFENNLMKETATKMVIV